MLLEVMAILCCELSKSDIYQLLSINSINTLRSGINHINSLIV